MKEGRVIWVTGRPASGKTTLARGLIAKMRSHDDEKVLWLDSDDLRAVLTPDATYSEQERDGFYRAIGHLAKLGVRGGVTVIVSATGSQRSYRSDVRNEIDDFVEVWITCDRDVLRERDVKGLYAQAETGAISNLPGVDAPFEAPRSADLVLDSGKLTREQMVDEVYVRITQALPDGDKPE